jgi:phosphomannomutase
MAKWWSLVQGSTVCSNTSSYRRRMRELNNMNTKDRDHLYDTHIVDVKSTSLFAKDEILKNNKCKTIYWKTGHSYIKRKVNEEKAIAGFEKKWTFFLQSTSWLWI